jgi:hypothetical protein
MDLEMYLTFGGYTQITQAADKSLGAEKYFFQILNSLNHHGRINKALFDLLRETRPAKAKSIAELEELWLGPMLPGPERSHPSGILDWVSEWARRVVGDRIVRDWNYELELSQAETQDWWCPLKVKQCRYTLVLPQSPWSFGLALGAEAIDEAWREHNPIHTHGIVTRTASAALQRAIQQSIEEKMQDPKKAWEFFFPSASIRIREDSTSPWIELQREQPLAIRNNLLLAQFRLPHQHNGLIGTEVDVDLSFQSVHPVHLREYTIHFKWMTIKANLSVSVNGNPESVWVWDYPVGPTRFTTPAPEYDDAIIKRRIHTDEPVMPDTRISVRWNNTSS